MHVGMLAGQVKSNRVPYRVGDGGPLSLFPGGASPASRPLSHGHHMDITWSNGAASVYSCGMPVPPGMVVGSGFVVSYG